MTVIGKSEKWPLFTPTCDNCLMPKDTLVQLWHTPRDEDGNDLGYRDDVFMCKKCLEKALAELANPEIVLGPD